MPSYNSKLKIIFFFLSAFILAGCANSLDLKQKQSTESASSVSDKTSNVQNKKPVRLLFVGDMMFDRYIRQVAQMRGNDYDYIFSGVKDDLAQYDLVIGNLEGPITDKSSVSIGTAMDEKKNLVFSFDPTVAQTLARNNIKLVSLGNNHILNQGEEGLAETEKYLDGAGVKYFGDTGGENQEFIIREIGGMRIGFVNYNYSVPHSFEKAVSDIQNIRSKSDIVVVFPHWGTEFKTGDPGQEIRSEAYKFIDAGADVVVGTHPHVIETSEDYKGKKIYYSLGNFIFDQYFQKETSEGLGVELAIKSDLTLQYKEVRFVMNKKGQTEIK